MQFGGFFTYSVLSSDWTLILKYNFHSVLSQTGLLEKVLIFSHGSPTNLLGKVLIFRDACGVSTDLLDRTVEDTQ